MDCKHDFKYVPPHKYRDAFYGCDICDMYLSVDQYEVMQQFYQDGREQGRADGLTEAAEAVRDCVYGEEELVILKLKEVKP